MIKLFRHYVPVPFVVLGVAEAVILWFCAEAGFALRFLFNEPAPGSDEFLFWRATLFSLVMMSIFAFMGLYLRHLRMGIWEVVARVLLSVLIGLPVLSLIYYIFPGAGFGRGVLALALVLAVVTISIARILFFRMIDVDTISRRILVCGVGRKARNISELLRRKSDRLGFVIVGYVDLGVDERLVDSQVISHDARLIEIVREYQVDEIVVAVDDYRNGFPIDEIVECKMEGVDVMDLPSFYEKRTGKVMLSVVKPSWLMYSSGFKFGTVTIYLKRILDIVACILLLLVSFPVLLVAMAAIYLEDRGPIFYRQRRVGKDNREFSILKLRSMRVDAEKEGSAKWAAKNDDRITRVGRIIRKLRIDEIPQIFNVLKGDMSFVGPRPERPEFVERLAKSIEYYNERHRVKPGITGWAQICYPYGDTERDSYEKLQFDLYYVKNYSIFLDLVILIQTAGAVLWGKGGR